MTEHFHIPGAWDPAESLLGRLIRHVEPDRLRADATFYVLAVAAVFGYLVLIFLGWAWINLDGAPSEMQAARFWTFQALGLAAVVAIAWVGWRRGAQLSLSDDGIAIQDGARDLSIPAGDIVDVSRIPSLEFHQHYRKYARTVSFPGRVPPNMVLISTRSHPLVLGIRPAEQAVFLERLGALIQARPAESHRVA